MTRDREISEAIDEAYRKASNKAYFANGFRAGVKFIEQEQVKNLTIPVVSNRRELLIAIETKRINSYTDEEINTMYKQINGVLDSNL
jgi:hypothetical protein